MAVTQQLDNQRNNLHFLIKIIANKFAHLIIKPYLCSANKIKQQLKIQIVNHPQAKDLWASLNQIYEKDISHSPVLQRHGPVLLR